MKYFADKTTILLGVVLLVVSAFLFSQALNPPPQAASAPVPAPRDPGSAFASGGVPDATGFTDKQIASLKTAVGNDPSDYESSARLGLTYLQKARESNDPTYYAQAETALNAALAVQPDDYDALTGLGALNLSLHNFRDARDWGMKASAVDPEKALAYGVIGDANIELGEYEQALEAFQKMVDIKPNVASYSRVSYARELHGDIPGAIEAMQFAVRAGSPAGENTAWCRVQLGNLYFNSRQIEKAEAEYNGALASFPNYLYAQAGLAQVRWAQGRTDEAVDLLKLSVNTVPLPQYISMLGDLYAGMGNTAAAKEQYDLVLFIYDLFGKNGVDVSIEKASFLADRDLDIEEALNLAETVAQERQDVNTQDVHAWALYKAGRYEEALAVQQKAMRLNTQNALFYFHLGMIYEKLGNAEQAKANLEKALQLNPYFSIKYAPEAKETLAKLEK